MPQALSIGRLVRATVNLQPLAAARRGFGTMLVIGDSSVIDQSERIRTYSTLDGVAADFGISAPEYQAALLYFGQTPRPNTMQVGRFVSSAVSGLINGGILTPTEQAIANFNAITAGALTITIDGVVKNLSALNFSADLNLNAVASRLTTALAGSGIVLWDGQRFKVVSTTTGLNSAVSYATTGALATLLKLTSATANAPVQGALAETPAQAVAALVNASGVWYGAMFAASATITDAQRLAVAAYIQGTDLSRVFGIGETSTLALDSTVTNDIGSQVKALNYTRTFVVYSPNPYSPAAAMGRAFSVNFAANRSTITLMYKQMPGLVPTLLTESQALTLKAKRINVFAAYQNDTAIYQYGTMAGQAYFDEIHGLDWFKDALQSAEYNVLYQSATKIPQTDPGLNQLVAVAASVCEEAINNGLVAPGQWNADGFGQLRMGDYLKNGYYIYAPPMALQSQSIREQRIAPPLQIGLKLAGAFHEMDAIINVNR